MRLRQEGHQDKKMLKEVNFEEEKQVKDKLRLKSDASVKLGILKRNVVKILSKPTESRLTTSEQNIEPML